MGYAILILSVIVITLIITSIYLVLELRHSKAHNDTLINLNTKLDKQVSETIRINSDLIKLNKDIIAEYRTKFSPFTEHWKNWNATVKKKMFRDWLYSINPLIDFINKDENYTNSSEGRGLFYAKDKNNQQLIQFITDLEQIHNKSIVNDTDYFKTL